MNLKIVLVGSALALLAVDSSRAADAIVEPPPVEIPVFTWTGFYVGIQGGYAWTNVDVDPGDLGIDDLNGGLLGGYLGYNWQSGPWVFGVEGEFNGVWNEQTTTILGPPAFNVGIGTDWLASIRGRVGYAVDRTLIFASGGVAFTEASSEVAFVGGPAFGGEDTYTGWTLGAGVEYAFTDNWLARLEYRYYDFSDQDLDGPGGLGDIDVNSSTVTVGVAYKF